MQLLRYDSTCSWCFSEQISAAKRDLNNSAMLQHFEFDLFSNLQVQRIPR